jgi:predicted chitinase
VGRVSGDLPLTTDGRTDTVYGEMYFHLPAGAQVFGQRPLSNNAQAMMQPPGQPAPAPQPLPAVHTTADALVVGLRYAAGEGAAGNRGDAYLTTYRMDGTTLGAAIEENDGEYNLYTTATAISNAYPATVRPAPSAVYELLRFGRVIGPDALTPATVPHWREVRYPGGQGWVNLNAANVHKFSDADFPQWRQWQLIDDAVGQDSRCDSAVIRGWLDISGDGQVDPIEATARLNDATIAAKLARTVCKFPTEWDAATIDARWGWLKTSTPENPNPLSNADFELLRAHITALAFWPGGMGIDAHHWHWHPKEFVRHFRKCVWLSVSELAQTLPRRRPAIMSWASARQRASNKAQALNTLTRKYAGGSTLRLAHLLAQVFIETDLLNTFTEYSQGNGYPYGAFYGRGLMQLTWAKNYAAYGGFRQLPNHAAPYADSRVTATSTHVWEAQGSNQRWAPRYDPQLIATNDYAAGDSGGFYWVSKSFRGTKNINRVCDLGAEARLVGYASWLVNGGGNGYRERQLYFAYVINEVLDEPRLTGNHNWSYPALGAALTGAFPPGSPPNGSSVQVNYERQIP